MEGNALQPTAEENEHELNSFHPQPPEQNIQSDTLTEAGTSEGGTNSLAIDGV